MTKSSEKKTVREIKIQWSESARLRDGQTFGSFAEANVALRFAAQDAPEGGAYDKTGFLMTYEDGETYEGRIDLTRKMTTGDVLGDHVRGFQSTRSGRVCPPHLTPARLEEMLSVYDASFAKDNPEETRTGREVAGDFLDGYQIGEADEAAAAAERAPVTAELPVVVAPRTLSAFDLFACLDSKSEAPAELDDLDRVVFEDLAERIGFGDRFRALPADVRGLATRLAGLEEGKRAKVLSALDLLLSAVG